MRPVRSVIDRLLGNVDESLIVYLLTRWREGVWSNALHLLGNDPIQVQQELICRVESEALKIAEFICGIATPPAESG
ncbi:MAG: DUF5995 family protein [Chloroflexota bacterium]